MREELKTLEKEFWGILSFETNLYGLAKFLSIEQHDVFRLLNWILFPETIPTDTRETFIELLKDRDTNADYQTDWPLTEAQCNIHQLMMELLRIKHAGNQIEADNLSHIFTLPSNSINRILQQFIKRGILDEEAVLNIAKKYEKKKKTNEGGENY